MGQDIDFDEQVPVMGTVFTGFTVPLHAEAHPVIDPGRDMDGYFPFHPGMTGTPACLTDFFRDFSPPFTLRAGSHPDELPERGICCLPHLARTATAGAGVEFLRLASRPAAGRAGFGMHHFDFTVHAGHCIFEPYLDPHQEVCTGLGAGPPLARRQRNQRYRQSRRNRQRIPRCRIPPPPV